MEEGEKRKPSIFIIIGLIIVIIIIGIIIVLKLLNNKPKENEVDDVHKNVVKDSVSIEKLNTFVNAAMFNDFGYEGLAYDFAKGKTKLTKNEKMKITFQLLTNIKFDTEKIDEDTIHDKYKNDQYLNNPDIIMSQISSRTFEKEYEKLFNENITYDENDLKEMNTCPSIYKFDSRIKKIFLFNECKLEGDSLLLTKIYNYKFENDYYYVYQYVGIMKNKKEGEEKNTFLKVKSGDKVDIDYFSGNENKFDKLIWKFDKNYNFISTSIEE